MYGHTHLKQFRYSKRYLNCPTKDPSPMHQRLPNSTTGNHLMYFSIVYCFVILNKHVSEVWNNKWKLGIGYDRAIPNKK